MRRTATDGVAWSVCWSVTIVSPAKTMEMPFGMWTWLGPRKRVLDGGPDPHMRSGNFLGAEWPAQEMPGSMSGD